jgi:hypothetical protein
MKRSKIGPGLALGALGVLGMLGALGALGSVAAGAPGGAARPAPWADWVGDYSGKVAWRGCTAPGAASAAIAVDAVDGVMSIDLAPLGGGLRAMSLVEEEGGWTGQQGDVKVRIARAKAAGAIELAVELDSGCTVRGPLARAGTGVVACDRLAGWSRIEARCGKLAQQGKKPLEDAALIAKTKWRAADGEKCTARAARLELALIDAGCAPHPDPAIGARAPECLRLVDATARAVRCKTMPPALEAELSRTAHSLHAASQTAEPAALGVVEQQCRDAKAALAAIATRFQCPL